MSFLVNHWYKKQRTRLSILLYPFSMLFTMIARMRKSKKIKTTYKSGLPVIVVGNITVGGTGKTPVVEALCDNFIQRGMSPAVISRGFGGKAKHYPFVITKETKVSESGDEPYMLWQLLNTHHTVPVAISPKRIEAVKYIEENLLQVDVIISDDGLQHYQLSRDFEIAVFDGKRLYGNGLCLPAGPLREPLSRLASVDAVLINGDSKVEKLHTKQYHFSLQALSFINLKTQQQVAIKEFVKKFNDCHAVAGIGNPQRFFDALKDLGLNIKAHPFADHHLFCESDLLFDFNLPIIMTHKDAVKCQQFAKSDWWYLKINPVVDKHFYKQLMRKLNDLKYFKMDS